jgi:hypothetical protein
MPLLGIESRQLNLTASTKGQVIIICQLANRLEDHISTLARSNNFPRLYYVHTASGDRPMSTWVFETYIEY